MKEYLRFMWNKHPGRLLAAELLLIPLYLWLGSFVFWLFPRPETAGVEGVTTVVFYTLLGFILIFALIITAIEFLIEKVLD